MELLPPRSWSYHTQWSQTTGMQFLNEKNTNNKVKRWGLEIATYKITFEWISGDLQQSSRLPLKIGRVVTGQASHSSYALCHQPWWTCIQHQKWNCSMDYHRRSYYTTTDWCSYTRCHRLAKQYTETWSPQIDYRTLLQMQRTGPFCKLHFQALIQWKSTQTWSWSPLTCKRITLQTCHRFKPKILGSCHT